MSKSRWLFCHARQARACAPPVTTMCQCQRQVPNCIDSIHTPKQTECYRPHIDNELMALITCKRLSGHVYFKITVGARAWCLSLALYSIYSIYTEGSLGLTAPGL